MNKRRIYLAVFILVLLSIVSSSVYAQNMLDTVLTPFEKINIGATYEEHWYIVDCVMYFIILVGMAQFVFSQQFSGKGGKAIIIGMGISLSIAASYFEYKADPPFHLFAVFGPIAIILVILIFLVGAYKFAQGLGAGGKGFAMLSFSFLFFYIMGQMPVLANWFANNTNEFIRLVWALLNLLAIVFLIWGLISVFSSLAGLGGGGGGGERGPGLLDRIFGNRDRGPGRGRDRDRRTASGEGPEGNVPSDEMQEYDEKNPGFVKAYVTDLKNNPLGGVEVILTGAKSGWPRQLMFWRRRGPFWRGETGDDGIVVIKAPSGNLRIQASAKGWRFYDISCKNLKTTYILVEPGETTDILIRMRTAREPHPKIAKMVWKKGRTPESNEYYFLGRIE